MTRYTCFLLSAMIGLLIGCGNSGSGGTPPVHTPDSPPSGLVTIALLHPRFPVGTVHDIIRVSPHPAFAFLYRSFGSDIRNAADLTNRLILDSDGTGNPITVYAYLDCGPCYPPRRPYGTVPVLTLAKSIDELNRRLESRDPAILQAYTKAQQKLQDGLPAHNMVSYRVYPVLEDNLTTAAWNVLNETLKPILAPGWTIGRNPLDPVPSENLEIHSYSQSVLGYPTLATITGDGANMLYDGESCSGGVHWTGVRDLSLAARASGVGFLVWRPEHQGLPFCRSAAAVPADMRTFSFPGADILKEIIK